MSEVAIPVTENTPEEQEQPERPRRSVKETVKAYIAGKTTDETLQTQMVDRCVSVARAGAKAVRESIRTLFSEEAADGSQTNVLVAAIDAAIDKGEPLLSSEVSRLLSEEQHEILEGQDEKIQRMEQFVRDMTDWAAQFLEDTKKERPDLTDDEYKKLVAETQKLVVDATRSITYQDTKASAVTLGDHGWMHLTQDLRDSVAIAEGMRGEPLSAKEKFMLGLAAAYHDIGYAVPEVSDPQIQSKGKYGSFDKGHPINSYVFMVGMHQRLSRILGKEDAQNLEQTISNHENPERANLAGSRADLSLAFAWADAGAAFGADKLPPIVVQIPDILTYLNTLNAFDSKYEKYLFPAFAKTDQEYGARFARLQQLDREKTNTLQQMENAGGSPTDIDMARQQFDQAIADAEARLQQRKIAMRSEIYQQYKDEVIDPARKKVETTIQAKIKNHKESGENASADEITTQAEAMLNAIDHFSPISLKFLLGRMSAESQPPRMETVQVDGQPQKKLVYDITAGFAHQMEEQGIIENTVITSAKLTVKLFSEQAAVSIKPPALEDAVVRAIASNSTESITADQMAELGKLGVTITDIPGGEEDKGVSLQSKLIAINSFGNGPISEENSRFYGQIAEKLDAANESIVNWINKKNETK